MSFTVSVTTLSMGLKTFEIRVTADTTVKQLKELIMQQDENCPPPDRQRLIYAKQELKNEHAALGSLNPPVNYGSKFSMASELHLDEVVAVPDIMTKVTHYHDVTEEVAVRPDMTVDEVLNELRMGTRGDIWSSGGMLYQGAPLDGHQILCDLPGFTTAPALQFFPPVNSNSAVITPVLQPDSALWVEVRFYEGTDHTSTLIQVSPERTVGDFKEDIAGAFSAMGKDIPRTRQHLVYSGQVKTDTDLVSSFPFGTRGTSFEPAIFQLYSRQGEGDHPLLPPTGDTESQASRNSSNEATAIVAKVMLPFLCFLVLGLGVVLCVLGAMSLTTGSSETGLCRASFSTIARGVNCNDRVLLRNGGYAYKPAISYLNYNTSIDFYTQPCETCNFTEALQRSETPWREVCPTGEELPIVTNEIPSELCKRAQDGTSPYYPLDGWLDKQGKWRSSAGLINVPEKLFLKIPRYGNLQDDNTGWNLSLFVSNEECSLQAVPPSAVEDSFGAVCMVTEVKGTVVHDRRCTGTDRRTTSYRLINSVMSSSACRDVCKWDCENPGTDKKTTFDGSCCDSVYDNTQTRCVCTRNKANRNTTAAPGHTAILTPPIELSTNTDPKNTVFFKYERKLATNSGFPDIALVDDVSRVKDCAKLCVETNGCKTFVYEEFKKTCQLWSPPVKEINQPSGMPDGPIGTATYTTNPHTRIVQNKLVLPTTDWQFAVKDDCLYAARKLLEFPFECHLDGDGSPVLGANKYSPERSGSGIAMFIISFVFLCWACCLCLYAIMDD